MTGDLALGLAGFGAGDHLHDPGAAWPVCFDVRRCIFGLELPYSVKSVPLLETRCSEWDVALSLEPAADLPVKGLRVGFDGQQEVVPLL